MVLLGQDRAAGAQNEILSELMALQMHDTGESGSPACMLTYYNALNELDARYARANEGEGVPHSILRTKLMELPEQYSFALHCLREADVEDRRLGRAPKTCQEIVDYVCAWEATQKRIARERGRQRSHRRVKRATGKGTQDVPGDRGLRVRLGSNPEADRTRQGSTTITSPRQTSGRKGHRRPPGLLYQNERASGEQSQARQQSQGQPPPQHAREIGTDCDPTGSQRTRGRPQQRGQDMLRMRSDGSLQA